VAGSVMSTRGARYADSPAAGSSDGSASCRKAAVLRKSGIMTPRGPEADFRNPLCSDRLGEPVRCTNSMHRLRARPLSEVARTALMAASTAGAPAASWRRLNLGTTLPALAHRIEEPTGTAHRRRSSGAGPGASGARCSSMNFCPAGRTLRTGREMSGPAGGCLPPVLACIRTPFLGALCLFAANTEPVIGQVWMVVILPLSEAKIPASQSFV
jgi:hypothetical protein